MARATLPAPFRRMLGRDGMTIHHGTSLCPQGSLAATDSPADLLACCPNFALENLHHFCCMICGGYGANPKRTSVARIRKTTNRSINFDFLSTENQVAY